MANEDIDVEMERLRMRFSVNRGAEMLGAMVRLDKWVTQELRARWRADLLSRWGLFVFFAIGLLLNAKDWSKDGFTIVEFLISLSFTILAAYLIVDKQKRKP